MVSYFEHNSVPNMLKRLICQIQQREEAYAGLSNDIFHWRRVEQFQRRLDNCSNSNIADNNENACSVSSVMPVLSGLEFHGNATDQRDCLIYSCARCCSTRLVTEVMSNDMTMTSEKCCSTNSQGRSFVSALSLEKRKGNFDEAAEYSQTKPAPSTINSGFNDRRFQNVSKDIAPLTNVKSSIGDEIKEDILNLVESMKLSPSEYVTEKDISGLEDVKKLIKDKIINPIKRPDLHLGLHKPPKGILLFGPPGTGKTLLAKWVASASGATFYEVSPSALISKFYGETETIIKALFKIAEQSCPSVIFIDEIDALLGRRRDTDDDTSIRMKNQLLQMMDGIASDSSTMVVLIGATNRPEILDEAAVRRLSRRVLVPLPDIEARQGQIASLLDKHYNRRQQDQGNKKLEEQSTTSSSVNEQETCSMFSTVHAPETDNVLGLKAEDLLDIAARLEGWNGADIKTLCTKAAEYPFDDAIGKYGELDNIPDVNVFRKISYDDFLTALKEVKPSGTIQADCNGVMNIWQAKFGSR